ncbi:MAG: M48 family metallopeptidase [Conexivisphaerales archaeon]
MSIVRTYSINGKVINYTIKYRRIRYPRLEFKTGNLVLVLPQDYNDDTGLIEKHKRWVESRLRMIHEALEQSTSLQLEKRDNIEFRELVKKIAEEKGEFKGKIRNIYIRRMYSKWASYSAKKNLTINSLARYLPEELLEYIILHEVTHARQKRHNSSFWGMISKAYPDFESQEKKLFGYWFAVNRL